MIKYKDITINDFVFIDEIFMSEAKILIVGKTKDGEFINKKFDWYDEFEESITKLKEYASSFDFIYSYNYSEFGVSGVLFSKTKLNKKDLISKIENLLCIWCSKC